MRNAASVAALLTITAGSVLAIGQQGVPWFSSHEGRQRGTLVIRDANGLIVRSPVLLRGVPIGEVSAISVDADSVAIEFWYPNTIRLPIDSKFRIENLSALGETYLSIKPQHDDGPILADNQRVVGDPNTVPGTVGEMAVAVTGLLHDLDPQRVNGIINELSVAFSDTASVPSLAQASQRLNAVVGENKAEVREVLTRLQTILGRGDSLAPALTALPVPLGEATSQLQQLIENAVALCYESTGKYPDDLRNGAQVVLARISTFEDDIGTNLYNLTEPLLPPMQATAAAMSTIDTSRLLDATMAALETPGAFTVHVVPGG